MSDTFSTNLTLDRSDPSLNWLNQFKNLSLFSLDVEDHYLVLNDCQYSQENFDTTLNSIDFTSNEKKSLTLFKFENRLSISKNKKWRSHFYERIRCLRLKSIIYLKSQFISIFP